MEDYSDYIESKKGWRRCRSLVTRLLQVSDDAESIIVVVAKESGDYLKLKKGRIDRT